MSDAPARAWTVLEVLRWTRAHFAKRGIESARLDAELLLAHVRGVARLRLYLDFEEPVSPAERARFRTLLRRRAEERVPVAQLTGEKEFWSLPLEVTPAVLTPRPDTETLVEALLARAPGGASGHEPRGGEVPRAQHFDASAGEDAQGSKRRRAPQLDASAAEAELRVLDLGTGSGAIALALASEWPKAQFVASDISADALEVARRNVARHGASARVHLVAGDAFEPFTGERFDVIASNPPYLSAEDGAHAQPELAHEPRVALFAEQDGRAMLRRIVAEAPGFLNAGGLLALELAPAQAEEVAASLARAGFEEISVHGDLGGRARAVLARLGQRDESALE